jgi:hypothetical protein
MVSRTRLNITLYAHCLSCLNCELPESWRAIDLLSPFNDVWQLPCYF